MRGVRAQDLVVGGVLVLAVAFVYAPVGGHGFVSYDDPGYILNNPRVLTGLGWNNVAWASTTFYFSNWHPLTWISYMLDVECFGVDPGAMHRTNAALHGLNVLLVYALLRQLTGERWPSALVAALFGLHPLHVESVAWVSQRKDVLSTCFGLLSLAAYAVYARRGSLAAYLASLALLALGLMAKPMLVTWPFVMLLLDVWPLGRLPWPGSGSGTRELRRALLEKLPFFALVMASSALTWIAQERSHAVIGLERVPLDLRLANAVIAYVAYLGKALWPVGLAPLYPHPAENVSRTLGALCLVLLVALSAAALRFRRSHPPLAVGWLWFLGTLVPVIGLVQVGDQALADRYTYVPALGLYLALAWGVRDAVSAAPRLRPIAIAVAAAALLTLAVLAHAQVRHWRDSLSLFGHTLRVTRDNSVAHTHYANALLQQGSFEESLSHYRMAESIQPGLPWNRIGIGNALLRSGRLAEARRAFTAVLARDPTSFEAHIGLGNAALAAGDARLALASFRRAVELAPDSADALNNAGAAAASSGDLAAAIPYFEAALERRPGYREAEQNLAKARRMLAERSGAGGPSREAGQ